jgi:hypothetical protein
MILAFLLCPMLATIATLALVACLPAIWASYEAPAELVQADGWAMALDAELADAAEVDAEWCRIHAVALAHDTLPAIALAPATVRTMRAARRVAPMRVMGWTMRMRTTYPHNYAAAA